MRALRWFVYGVIVVVTLFGAFLWWATPKTAPESLIFVGGDIVTMADPPIVEAMWVTDGRVGALGAEKDVRTAAGTKAKTIDLQGATLMPGLIEPHTHPIATAMLGGAIDVSGFTHDSRASVMRTLREGAAGFTPTPWIVAFGWDPVIIADLDPPTLAELDDISPEKPLLVLEQMAHEAYVNSAALRVAGIDKHTPDPEGGAFVKDAQGELTGAIHEVNAIEQLLNAMPPLPSAVARLLLRFQYAAFARAGYTTIGVLGPVGRADDPIGMMRALANDRYIPVRTVVYGLPSQLSSGPAPETRTDTRFILRGVKFWMDGSPYTGGAAFEDPYEDSPLVRERLHLPPGSRGALNHDAEAFNEAFARFHRDGYQVAVHTQGERAVRRVLDAGEAALRNYPRPDHRHRLEHNALISAEQIRRARSLGFELSFFIDHIYYYGHRLPDLVGERVERYMPVGTAFREGHRATIHTDNPTTPVGPFRAMRTAVLRIPRNGGEPMAPSERLTVEQALRAMTVHAARQLGVETHRGSLEVNKAADLVVLSRNPFDTPPEELGRIQVLGTWIDGQPIDTRVMSRPNLGLAGPAIRALALR